MSEEQIALRQMLERREREYLLRTARAKIRSSIEDLTVGDFHVEKLAEGEWVELPRWVVDELVSQGMAEASETPFENEVFNALSREKMMGPLQLSGLTPDFYVRMRRRLGALASGVAEGKARREDVDRLRAVCYDLIGIRLSKLLSLSSSSAPASALAEKLTPEESSFFAISQSLSKEWKSGLLGGAK
ncbi:MAG: hypothetical protein JRN06_10655 [Nitrososphaerota archaeon]|nr:hypothetical protein [Nitrososphaerota archaeon]